MSHFPKKAPYIMYTDLIMKFEQFREDSSLYSIEERKEILKAFKADKKKLESESRRPSII